jgi:hypothetical protein
MARIVTTKLLEALADIGVDVSKNNHQMLKHLLLKTSQVLQK